MVLVDIRETMSAKAADIFLQIRPGKDFEVVTTLRALVKNQPVDRERVAETGLTVEKLQDIVDRMKRAKFGVIFFGMGLSMTRGKHMNSAGILKLAAEMNAFTKFVCMPMRGHGNVTGADVVLRWTTGYPFGISLSRGYPRFNPGEFSTVDLLVRGDNDAALILGADPGATMPQPAIDHLARIPTIVLDPKVTHTSRLARVHITTAVTGVSATGHRVPHGRDTAAASAGPEVAVSVRRRGRQAHHPRGGGKAVVDSCPTEPDDRVRLRPVRRDYPAPLRGNRRSALEDRVEGLSGGQPGAWPNQENGSAMLRITGGRVYDPANGIDGVVKDICIADGRVVAQVDGGRTIDASGMIVFPGGVDVHTHVAGGALNFARGLVPENQRVARKFLHTPKLRAGIGGMTPTTFATGYLYAGMGWTTVNEAAVPILSARHTHEELHDIPIVDKSTLLLMANNEIVLDLLEAGEVERAKHVVAWLIWAAKAYGVKAVNPGGVAAWKWGKNASTLHDPIEGYHQVTAAKIISGLAGIVDDLGLPHPLHLHCNNLGVPGNVTTTLETMKVLEGHRAHLAHLQFHAYGGDDWGTMRSEAAAIAEAFNNPHEPDGRRGGDPLRRCRDDHRRRSLAAPAP